MPRPSVPLGSCTASSPSPGAIRATSELLDDLRAGQRVEDANDAHRRRLRALFELTPDTPIALLPSGTDAVYLVSMLGLCRAASVHHVVVGASELGGGTLRAARGLSISDHAPFGESTLNSPLAGLAGRCSAEPIYLRNFDGRRKDPEDIDRRIAERVRQAAREHLVVLHLVAHSKTGLRAPAAETCSRLLTELGDRLIVLVDGAQGRLAPRDVRQALRLGFTVLFTGSKFYGGPPFSCALMLPPRLARDPGPLAPGVRDWFSQAALPGHWLRARDSLREAHNVGVTLRWQAALYEIDAYHALSPRHRAGTYHTFSGAVYEAFGPSKVIKLDVPRPPTHQLVTALGAFPSVFGFSVWGSEGYLRADSLRELHVLVDTDRSDVEPELGGAFHLGQPVALGPPTDERPAVLRVALGARLTSDHANSPDAGASFFRKTLLAVRRKIERIVERGEVG